MPNTQFFEKKGPFQLKDIAKSIGCINDLSKNENFKIMTSKRNYLAKNVIIATGFYDLPYKLEIPGEDLKKVRHYYDDPHPYFGMKIAIVGAGNSAVDVALETFRKGCEEVSMIIREPKLNSNIKYWVKPDIENRIKEIEERLSYLDQVGLRAVMRILRLLVA